MRYSNNYYGAASADDMVDISSGVARKSSTGARYSGGGNGNKKKAAVIVSISAAVAAALGVAGFVIFNAKNNEEAAVSPNKEFTFADKTSVSGFDISGMTLKEAKALLEANKQSLIAPVKFSVNVGTESVELTQNNFEYTFDIDEVLGQVKLDAEKKTSDTGREYSVTATVTEESVKKNAEAVGEKYNVDPVNAYVTDFHPYADNRFDYAEEIDGFTVDSEDLQTQLNQSFQNGGQYFSIDAKVDTENAEVTVDFLKKNLVKLSSYKTYSSNTLNGDTNMRISLEACNGSIIDPGKQWSFNECTGDSNQESLGYKPAGVISEGRSTTGIGGGICQSSSTIYNAALRANMKIVERYCHKWPSVYVPTGLDATIDYPGLDLTLQNDSGYQMFLECKMSGKTLYASFWGYQDPSYDRIEARNELGESSGSSYSVKAWRVYYKDGKKVGEEELPSSSYSNDQGVSFESAEGDYRAEYENVDSLEANAGSDDTDTNTSSQSNDSSQTASQTAAIQETETAQPSANTEQQSSAASEAAPESEAPEPETPEPDSSDEADGTTP